MSNQIRKFDTGATRDSDEGKPDYEGFLSPLAIEAFGEYMNTHRVQSDGSLRASDNWQKGIPKTAYMKSLWRHFFDIWKLHRGLKVVDKKTGKPVTMKEALCASLFNVQGLLHEELKTETEPAAKPTVYAKRGSANRWFVRDGVLYFTSPGYYAGEPRRSSMSKSTFFELVAKGIYYEVPE